MSKWADLKTRTLSAVVMVAGFIAIVEAGKTVFSIAMLVAWLILLWEWWGFSHYRTSILRRLLSLILGGIYITLGVLGFWFLYFFSFDYKGEPEAELNKVYVLAILVAAIDIGGYIFGKLFGKHKLWPSVSPGKTWEGLLGSIVFGVVATHILEPSGYKSQFITSLIEGTIMAILALSGDLLESRMKRKAGLKDSGKLIPGHGGLFDRVDGLLPCVIFVAFPMIVVGIIGALAGSVTGSR